MFENLAWGKGEPAMPIAVSLGSLASERHRVNLLDPEVRDIGIGMAEGSAAEGGPTGMFCVAEFGAIGEPARALDRPVRARCSRSARRNRARAFVRGHVTRGRCARPRS